MVRNVVDGVADVGDMDEAVSRLPGEVQLALADIAEVAREGLLALSVSTGLAVLAEMMETERTVLCGPIHAKDPDREATRAGCGVQPSRPRPRLGQRSGSRHRSRKDLA